MVTLLVTLTFIAFYTTSVSDDSDVKAQACAYVTDCPYGDCCKTDHNYPGCCSAQWCEWDAQSLSCPSYQTAPIPYSAYKSTGGPGYCLNYENYTLYNCCLRTPCVEISPGQCDLSETGSYYSERV